MDAPQPFHHYPFDLNGDDELLLSDFYELHDFDLSAEENPFSSAARCIFGVIGQRDVANLLIGLVGFALVWSNSVRSELVVPLFVYFLFATLVILSQLISVKGIFCSTFTIFFVLFCQLLYSAEDFTVIRGALMVAAMKMISLAFDAEDGSFHTIGLGDCWHSSPFIKRMCSMFAFVFSPCSVLFGPPIQFAQFDDWTFRRVHSFGLFPLLKRLLHFALLLLSSLLFLSLSSCLIDPSSDFFPSHLSPWLFLHFLNAQSFRFSHFFVCYLASACAVLAGHPTVEITRWTSIEWPRSMAEVAVHWNKPMHFFLHKYVYRRAKVRLGSLFSLLLTFAVSSALHGFDFQMLAVLLSLGLFAFSETKCPANCHHRYKKAHFSLLIVRLCFTLVNIFLLIYLGSPFHGEGQFTGYSAEHLLSIWRDQFHYSGHLIAFVTIIISFVIPRKCKDN
ncbi:hypothetical protein niasHT_037778 [Heterodera trifolii]|uniref:Protein-serine O-palmitoleoyltransferase porcupine n=1 Tax=Heterodera trifolii TaxID=157864 RepID=A0ABD2J7V9_9BILA